MATKKTETKPKTAKCRILVAVDKDGCSVAFSDTCNYFSKFGARDTDGELLAFLSEKHDEGRTSPEMTCRFIEIELPVPGETVNVKTITVKDV